MAANLRRLVRARNAFRKGFVFMAALLVTNAVTYGVTRLTNSENAAEQQALARLSQFEDSGSELDQKFAAFSHILADTALEEQAPADADITAARRGVREALMKHASQAKALSPAFGDEQTLRYLQNLKTLNATIEGARGADDMRTRVTDLAVVLEEREKLVEHARENI